MSDGKIIYDVDINDEGIESKVQQTNSKVKNSADTGSSAFGEVWTGALRRIGAGAWSKSDGNRQASCHGCTRPSSKP